MVKTSKLVLRPFIPTGMVASDNAEEDAKRIGFLKENRMDRREQYATLTYGNVKAYDPRDGVTYHYYTTMKGVIEKEGPVGGEFEVPTRLKELYAKKDFGRYTNRRGELPTCFITNNDITGGNSGSPVIDARGRLIGLAFDGNSEAMSGDIDFEENLQRCICLDSRYMLWVIDVYAGAKNLIEEMDIVR